MIQDTLVEINVINVNAFKSKSLINDTEMKIFAETLFTQNNDNNQHLVSWLTGSRIPASHAEESNPRCQDSREDEADQTGGGRQPDAAGKEGQDQE